MRIAICIADNRILKSLKQLIYLYAEKTKIDIMVDCFTTSKELLYSAESCNIIFLNYNIIGEAGLDIARKLRSEKSPATIVFIGNYAPSVLEAFTVKPYRFLVTPLKKSEIFNLLDDFFTDFSLNYPLLIRCKSETVCLKASDIVYLEADNKHCFIHLKNEAHSCNHTMARVYNLLPKYRFCKINRAFIVNFDYISRYNSDMLTLKTGEELHISRNYLKSFKDEYISFLNPAVLM